MTNLTEAEIRRLVASQRDPDGFPWAGWLALVAFAASGCGIWSLWPVARELWGFWWAR